MWEMVRLGDICNLITCGVAKRPNYQKDGIPFLSSLNVKENKIILDKYNFISIEDHLKLTKYNKPERGDILYTRVGSFGEAYVVDVEFEFSIFVSLTLIKPKKEFIDSRFLMWFLNSPAIRLFAQNNTSGIGVQNLNVSVVREYRIPLPPLAIQQQIVAILDKADRLRQLDKVIEEKYDALAQSIFIDMFGDPVKNEKGWEVKKLGDICSKITDGTHKTPDYQNEGVIFLSAKNVKDGKLNNVDCKYISREEHNIISKRCNIEQNDILITKSGSLGMAAIVKCNYEFSIFESLALLKYIRGVINVEYLHGFLNQQSTKQLFDRITKGVGVKHLHLTDLRGLDVIIPPIELQNEFAKKIAIINQMKEQEMKGEELFQALLQKAFKRELVS